MHRIMSSLSYKGLLHENVYTQMIHAHNKECYYYEPNTEYEIDFIFYFQVNTVPMEVKSSNIFASLFISIFLNQEKSMHDDRKLQH